MSCSIKEKLAQYYLNFRKNNHLYLFNKGMPKKAEKELLNFILNEQLNIEDEYHSYRLEENKIVSLVFARKNNDEGEDTLVSEMIIQDNCITKSMIKTKYASIVNILAKQKIVPELLQAEATPKAISAPPDANTHPEIVFS